MWALVAALDVGLNADERTGGCYAVTRTYQKPALAASTSGCMRCVGLGHFLLTLLPMYHVAAIFKPKAPKLLDHVFSQRESHWTTESLAKIASPQRPIFTSHAQ